MDELFRWLTVLLLLVGVYVLLGWFLSTSPTWEKRRKVNEYPRSAREYVRKLMWKGPASTKKSGWESFEGRNPGGSRT